METQLFSFLAFLIKFSLQIIAKKEPSKVYDAGIAIDDVSFLECALPKPEESCPPNQWHCMNKVII